MAAIKSAVLSSVPGLVHGFGSIAEPVPPELRAAWDSSHPSWKQVHGVAIAEVREARQQCGEVDAVFTRVSGLPVAVITADCVPVLLANRKSGCVAAIHAGWRGTRGRILENLWRGGIGGGSTGGGGSVARDWVAAVGPSIGPCCYEVSEELAVDFEREFGGLGAGLAVPRFRHLDLPAINAAILRRMGFAEVDLIRACTRCSVDASGLPLFHSFRREGGKTRQWSVGMLG